MIYFIIIVYLMVMRLVELVIAHSNERYQKNRGAIEITDPYYKLIVLTHIFFFVGLIGESVYVHSWERNIFVPLLLTFIALQIFRFWCISSLGRYWNTKVIILPGGKLIKKGPYKWISHPNYLVVGLEFVVISLLFHAYLTLVIFITLHILLMRKRIPMENEALKTYL